MELFNSLNKCEDYMFTGDIGTIISCIIFFILIKTSYIPKNRSFTIFKALCMQIFSVSILHMLYYVTLNNTLDGSNSFVMLPAYLQVFFHIGIYLILCTYIIYMQEPMKVQRDITIAHTTFLSISFCIFSGIIITELFTPAGLNISKTVYGKIEITENEGVFPIGYIYFLFFNLFTAWYYRKRIYKKITYGLFAIFGLSVIVTFGQLFFNQSSFTILALSLPLYAFLYLCHSNPYDLETGSVDRGALNEMVKIYRHKNKEILFVEFYMHSLEKSGKEKSNKLYVQLKDAFSVYFKNVLTFNISPGSFVMISELKKNKDKNITERLKCFKKEASNIFKENECDFKSIILKSNINIRTGTDYLTLMKTFGAKIPENTFKFINKREFDKYVENLYILSQLEDIRDKKDLFDKRVVVYCQPVYNVKNNRYDTAEALMRLELDELGLVVPDRFIPIAEKNDCIQVLSLIILNKTCFQIKNLIDDGYQVDRISVNFTISDIRDKNFCDNIKNTIKNAGIPYSSIAIEVTESQNESDFYMMKKKIKELRSYGIKFYLDDFGTGYSNFERIMELPFDIIKFDKSLVGDSLNGNKKKEKMVLHLADMFNEAKYSILYEGVEDEDCAYKYSNMHGKYLQGYYYSAPIPIENLTEYFCKES